MMMLPTEVIESVLYESGINRAKTKEIIERSKLVMSERLIDIQPYMNSLYMKAIELGVKPAANGTISEQQAVKLLGKSKAFFRVARLQNRLTPNCILIGKEYRYTIYNIAEYLAKRDSYKAL